MLRKAIYPIVLLLLVLPFGELAARFIGYKPLRWDHYKITSSPTNCITGDSMLGFRLNPGSYSITINSGLKYNATHLNNGQRFCDRDTAGYSSIGLFGCSFTYGMGVDDTLTFAHHLAKKLPETNVTNHSVPGYGTVQSFLQIKNLLAENELPDQIVICFSKHHFKRNGLTPFYRRDLILGYGNADLNTKNYMHEASFPYMQEHRIVKEKWTDLYASWPGRKHSALINLLNSKWDDRKEKRINTLAITKEIFDEIIAICKSANKELLFFFLDDSPEISHLQSYLDHNGISYLNGSWDISRTAETNHPYDDHPNAKAHKRLSDLLIHHFSRR
ncbi:MAG: SGNH/GDSL hydrolase family protein [Bacteroidetes bacterium]|nr:MAG: SGNH/GDSL hydrolase family protein [Bacteroidota bacterium]TNE98101.1 MAG: SGNH/GDSL hydrolase family protein [Bacteroidota bacterium]